ncbi:helix-turn-helix domain-containing protein [Streptomyces albipurpureus]|uniref:XRE family transcriptional regulator n=1 Tax=Streptomyces albipurpureus TaxID=2897419 RepID=A0ABT0UH74_9ACTN|nr:XRE family transcriptional regulator [Streptomyces sp. CWNU-1]MCM2387572.1 XRE family transcriptional regulator [Streptomyces sp. CWNU-1]
MTAGAVSEPEGPAAAPMLHVIGARIRARRAERGLSVERLSALSGISAGMLSLVERGKANPSFTTLLHIAHGLGVSIGWFFDSDETRPHSPVVRKSERRGIEGSTRPVDGIVREALTPSASGVLEAVWLENPPGFDSSATPYQHDGVEFGFVLSGTWDVYLNGERHRLEAGDTITYDCDVPHWHVNPGEEPTTAIWVVTPPRR